jgi:hypothetical protein
MAFEKGQSGNPGGRPKGAGNKVTAKLRETISGFLDEQFDKVKEDFAKLKPAERIRLYIELLQYGVPKLQSVQVETEFDRLPDDQLQLLADELIEKLKSANNE